MQYHKLYSRLVQAFSLSLLTCLLAAPTQAYQSQQVYKTEHFAIHEVILESNELFDAALQNSITRDVQTQNRLDQIYQASAVVFPYGSQGFKGKINSPIEGVLTVAAWGSGKDRIYFNRKAKHLSEGGLYLAFPQIVEMINQKTLQPLLAEIKQLPLVLTSVPVSATGFDPITQSFYITSAQKGIVFDTRIDDSVYYNRADYVKIKKDCKVDLLTFTDRLIVNIPFFMSGRSAVNRIACP